MCVTSCVFKVGLSLEFREQFPEVYFSLSLNTWVLQDIECLSVLRRETLTVFLPFFCPNRSLGLLHDQLSYSDSDDWAACQGENIHVQEAHALPQLDRSADQRSGTPTECQGWIEIIWQFECFELWSVINVLIDIKWKEMLDLKVFATCLACC